MERERLEQQRVVEVVDDVPAAPGQALHGRDRQLLGHDRVERLDELPEASVAEVLRAHETNTREILVGLVRDHQGHVEAVSQLHGELPVPDAGPAIVRPTGSFDTKDAGHGLRG